MLFPSALRAKLQEKNKNDSHHQKSPPSVETDTAITWEASLQSAHLALTVKAVDVLCVSMRAIMHVPAHWGLCYCFMN